jgi:hypothetical protein
MYPWKEVLNNWANRIHLRVDALGLVTILGSEEVDRSIGRLVPSGPLGFLPLLGAFVISGNRFTDRKSGFTVYNISSGVETTEIAAWFSRWLKAQEFSQAGDIVHFSVVDKEDRRGFRWWYWVVGLGLIGVPLNGMLIALTVLSGDWWGFTNAVAMVLSVVVREMLVWQHRAGIDEGVEQSWKGAQKMFERKTRMYAVMMANYEEEKRKKEQDHEMDHADPSAFVPEESEPLPPTKPDNVGKIIVVMDDAKVVTIRAPEYIIVRTLVQNPVIMKPMVYKFFRWVGWVAFAAHIITLGMATLHTQIYSVLMLIIATILTVSKVGCDDWRIRERIDPKSIHPDDESPLSYPCWISSRLQIRCSKYSERWAEWKTLDKLEKLPEDGSVPEPPPPHDDEDAHSTTPYSRYGTLDADVEAAIHKAKGSGTEQKANGGKMKAASKPPPVGRRQDLYVWLKPDKAEKETMEAWGLVPRNDKYWTADFLAKEEEHRNRREKNH